LGELSFAGDLSASKKGAIPGLALFSEYLFIPLGFPRARDKKPKPHVAYRYRQRLWEIAFLVSLLFCWRPRRDLNPCYRRERATPSRLYKNLEGAGGAVHASKTPVGAVGTAYRYIIVT
jgi:hypothetical protein